MKRPRRESKEALSALKEYYDQSNLVFRRLEEDEVRFRSAILKQGPAFDIGLAISVDIYSLILNLEKFEPTIEVFRKNFKASDELKKLMKDFIKRSKHYGGVRNKLEHLGLHVAEAARKDI